MASPFQSYCGLTEEDVSKKITDEHIEVISRSLCRQWQFLPAHLGLETIVVDDIAKSNVMDEREKRDKFLRTWKKEKGSEATYKKLIDGLLTIKSREDAESVYELLKGTDPMQQQQQTGELQQQPEERRQQPEEQQQQPQERQQQLEEQPEELQQQPEEQSEEQQQPEEQWQQPEERQQPEEQQHEGLQQPETSMCMGVIIILYNYKAPNQGSIPWDISPAPKYLTPTSQNS